MKTTVRLVRRGEQHPFVIEVITPGWRGCDHALDGTVKQTMPADLRKICDILKEANVRYISPSEPEKEEVIVFSNDGSAEFVLKDETDVELAVGALMRSGWLSPPMPSQPTIQ